MPELREPSKELVAAIHAQLKECNTSGAIGFSHNNARAVLLVLSDEHREAFVKSETLDDCPIGHEYNHAHMLLFYMITLLVSDTIDSDELLYIATAANNYEFKRKAKEAANA